MARITIEIDDELLGEAAHVLGTSGGEETVLAALRAAARGASPLPRTPGHPPLGDPPPLRPLGDPGQPEVPGPTRFPHPPEIH